jgi:hypothetical protein
MQELDNYLKEYLDYYLTRVHTSFPGVVTEYDPSTRRATIQPSLKRKSGNKEFVDFPLLVDVPVQFPGNKKWTIHFPLEKDDEVVVFFSERSLEVWKDAGQDGIEDPDPRRFSLSDAYCIPGVQPQEFIAAEEPGLQIVHKTAFNGDLISQILMSADKVEVKYKGKATVLMEDDRIHGKTDKCTFDMSGEKISMENGKNKFELQGAASLVSTGSDLVEIGNSIDTLGGILDALMASLTSLHTEGGPATHTASAWAASDIAPLKAKINQVFKK